jgi:hypothetical protein
LERDEAVQHDEEISAEELDELIDQAEALNVAQPEGGTEIRRYPSICSKERRGPPRTRTMGDRCGAC